MTVPVLLVVIFFGGGLGLSSGEVVSPPLLAPDTPVGAETPGPALKYETDRRVYHQGDVVRITVTNVSNVPTPIVNTPLVDGGFAVLEIKTQEGQWKPVELVAATDVHSFRSLGPGEQYEYVWKATREAHGEVTVRPGTYRIGFGRPFYTHPFEIIDK
ncbi:MAG: hypothetical protein ABW047_01235 [Nitrospiraceae bacterium]